MEKLLVYNKNGITLIALVITIIVLLILAGVSISMLTGDNGILTQAQNAKKETEEAQEDELRKLTALEAATNLIIQHIKIKMNKLQQYRQVLQCLRLKEKIQLKMD